MKNTFTEENYLKAIYKLSEKEEGVVNTNSIADKLSTKAASVTDMLKKLAEKKLIHYIKYQGVKLTDEGRIIAIKIIRKHRIWETFLVNKLQFKWDEVHQIAEELEHIDSDELIEKLYNFLGSPKFDPHGDPIPSIDGKFHTIPFHKLSESPMFTEVYMTGVVDHSSKFLQHLDKLGIYLGCILSVQEIIDYDKSTCIKVDGKTLFISNEVAKNILVSLN